MYSAEYKSSWKTLFSRLPCGDDTDRPDEHVNVLAALVREYGRDVHGHPDFKPIPADLDDYGIIDPVQFAGGPIEHGQFMANRRTVSDGDKRCVRKRRNKSSEFSDSGSDDNQAKNPDSKNENISRRKRKLLPADMQASVEEQVAEVVDVSCGKKKERIPRRNNKQTRIS